ncbi:hypothetical protein BJ138DRAFT_1120326 [Hygrophoropsis aurantiaca]|uniref:Uncharacterized protein n=1 Tax=Hygrophoropsis aurantiaca TaxID=72124 RepID=A0ACB7ZQY7_9AGAM|nr:hypothetical protein BJ138DRAFT_1120326 [Hygrophoropsis aurantiaca]
MKRSVDELRNLNTISWSNLGNQSIVSLARLPALRKAVFELPSDFPTYIERLPPHSPTMKPTFSRLRILGITHRDFASVTALLNNFEFHLMEDVRITSHYTSPSTSMQGFFAALASSSSHKTIRCITVYDELRGLGPDLTRFELGFYELRPLLQFEMLTYLNLRFVGLIILEDATLLKMADAWPHITSLHLNGRGPWHPGSHINPLTFIKVLERCPKLDELNVPMDFSAVDYVDFDPWLLDDLRNQDRKRAELSLLWLGPYIAVHPHAVAKFLAAVLPRLADIKMLAHNSSDPVACVQSWTQTEHIYRNICYEQRKANFGKDNIAPVSGEEPSLSWARRRKKG